MNRPWLKRRRSLSRKSSTFSRCSTNDTVACVRFAPLLLAHFEFHGAPAAAELLQALDLLRDLNASGKRTLPEHVPAGFVKPRWRPHVFPSSGVDRRFYELCALAELRDRLRAGDIWVTGSRQYRDFETYLIPAATFKVMQKEPLPLDIDTHLPSYLAECRQRLEDNLTTVACKGTREHIARCHTRRRGSAHRPVAQKHPGIRRSLR